MGRITDSIGRRNALFISSIVTGVGIILFGLLTSFIGIAFSYILWGVGGAINSSALESISYEYSTGHNLKYLEVFGIINFISAISLATASILGGILGSLEGLKIVIVVTGITVLLSSLYTVNIRERKRVNPVRRGSHDLMNYVRDRRVMSLIILRIAFVLNFNMMLIFKQPYYKEMGIATAIIGVIFFVDVFLRGVSSLFTQRLSFIAKNKFFSMLFFTSFTFFTIYIPGLLQNDISILFLILNSVIFGFYTNILSEEVNVQIPSQVRATVLSVILLVSSLLTAMAEPFLGYSATVIGLKTTMLIFIFIFLAVATFGIFIYIQGKDMEKFRLSIGRGRP
jgi:MFS family permease